MAVSKQSAMFMKVTTSFVMIFCIITLIKSNNYYNYWFNKRIKKYHTQRSAYDPKTTLETKRLQTYGTKLTIPQHLVKQLGNKEHLFLIPPYQYIKDKFDKNHYSQSWTEARVLHYMADGKLNHISYKDSNYRKATHTIITNEKRELIIANITTDAEWNEIDRLFKVKKD